MPVRRETSWFTLSEKSEGTELRPMQMEPLSRMTDDRDAQESHDFLND